MGRASRARTLAIWMNGVHVGHWRVTAQGEHQLGYAAEWLESAYARPLSLSLPLRPQGEPYRGPVVESYFDNLLPDSEAIRRQMMSRFGAASNRPFDLLSEVGRDCIGAVQLAPPETPPEDVRSLRGETLSEDDLESLLRSVAVTGIGAQDGRDFRISLAGNQEKTALLFHRGRWKVPSGTTPTTHILKLPMGDASVVGVDFSTSVENEWLCSQILRAFGIPVARCELARFGEVRVLVVERFDRRLSDDGRWITRRPQEDFCQATGTPPARKYERDGGPGIDRLMETLLGSSRSLEDREDLFRTLFVYWLLCAIDGHAKNFSLFLEAGGGYTLTPRYDVLSAYPVLGHGRDRLAEQKVKLAMAVLGKNRHYRWREIRLLHWIETAKRVGLARRAEPLMEELLAATPRVVDDVSSALPKGFPKKVAEPIFEGLRATVLRAKGR